MNTAGTDENLFRLVSVPGQGARVLPLELVPVPRHGTQICARAPTKGCVQTGTRGMGTSLNRALVLSILVLIVKVIKLSNLFQII